jgi:RNA polymerase sigma factor (sigma-70 family)
MDRMAERQYEAHARAVPAITPAREKELSKLILGGDTSTAVAELVEGNMRLVLSLTRKYRPLPDYVDILFDGNLGLVEAACTFDSDKGRFSTWATPKIRTEIREGIYQRTSALSSLRSAMEVLKRAEESGRGRDAAIVRLAMAGIIPLYGDDDKPIDVIDTSMGNVSDDLHKSDLLALAARAVRELGLTDDQVELVAEANEKNGNGEAVAAMSRKLGVTRSAVRMMRAKLVWMLRKKILGYVGKDEYLLLSATGQLPGRRWK